MEKDELNNIMIKYITYDKDFLDAYSLARQILPNGKIWLIGGAVYKKIISMLYELPFKTKDIDFITEFDFKINESNLPNGWKNIKNSFGNDRLIRDNLIVDLVPLEKISVVLNKKIKKPNISNFMLGTPVDIQQIVFDLDEKNVSGDLAIEAIKNKKININNVSELDNRCNMLKITKEQYLKDLSEKLNFEYSI